MARLISKPKQTRVVGGFLGFGSVEDSKAYSSASKAASVFGSLLGLLIAITGVAKLRNQCERLIQPFGVTLLCKRHGALRSIAYYRRGFSSGSLGCLG